MSKTQLAFQLVCVTTGQLVTADKLLSFFSAHSALTCHDVCAGGVRIPVGELLESPNDQLNFTLYNKTKQPSGTIQASTSKHSVTLQLGDKKSEAHFFCTCTLCMYTSVSCSSRFALQPSEHCLHEPVALFILLTYSVHCVKHCPDTHLAVHKLTMLFS